MWALLILPKYLVGENSLRKAWRDHLQRLQLKNRAVTHSLGDMKQPQNPRVLFAQEGIFFHFQSIFYDQSKNRENRGECAKLANVVSDHLQMHGAPRVLKKKGICQ